MTKTARTPATKRSSSPDESSQDETGRPPISKTRPEKSALGGSSSSSVEMSPLLDPEEDISAALGASISKHIRFDEEAGPSSLQQAADAHIMKVVALAIAAAFANRDAEASRRVIDVNYDRNVSAAMEGVNAITPMVNQPLSDNHLHIGSLAPNGNSTNPLPVTDDRATVLNNNIPNTPPSTVIDRKVEGNKYRKITSKSIEDSKLINVSVSSKNGIQLVKRIYNVINDSSLTKYLEEDYTCPIITINNKFGYQGEEMKSKMIDGQIFPEFHGETDAIKYMEERNMALSLLNAMIADDFDHLVNNERAKGNPATVYRIIKDHFSGQKNHHVESCREKVDNFTFISDDLSVDIYTLKNLISNLDQSMEGDTVMPESFKKQIIRKCVDIDIRDGLKQAYISAQNLKLDYNGTLDYMIENYNHLPNKKIISAAIINSKTNIVLNFKMAYVKRKIVGLSIN